MKTIPKLLIVAAAATLLSACAGTPVSLGTRSAVAMPNGAERAISAEACGFQLLLLIPIAINERMSRAYESLQAQAAGDYITAVQVQERWNWGLVGTLYCTVLQAKAIAAK